MALGKTRAQLLSELSQRELVEWHCYAELEPFGEPRADYRMGMIAATLANTHRDPKKKATPFQPSDFMPTFEPGATVDDEARATRVYAVAREATARMQAVLGVNLPTWAGQAATNDATAPEHTDGD